MGVGMFDFELVETAAILVVVSFIEVAFLILTLLVTAVAELAIGAVVVKVEEVDGAEEVLPVPPRRCLPLLP